MFSLSILRVMSWAVKGWYSLLMATQSRTNLRTLAQLLNGEVYRLSECIIRLFYGVRPHRRRLEPKLFKFRPSGTGWVHSGYFKKHIINSLIFNHFSSFQTDTLHPLGSSGSQPVITDRFETPSEPARCRVSSGSSPFSSFAIFTAVRQHHRLWSTILSYASY